MNKLTLKFTDTQLEEEYQMQKLFSIRKQIFYGLITISYILNVLKILLDAVRGKPFTQYLNFAYIGVMTIQLICIIRSRKCINVSLIVLNIINGFLEMNFDMAKTEKLEFYSFGSSFAQFQTVVYFVSNFFDGLIQVVCHLGMKIAITSVYSQKTDPFATIIAVASAIAIMVTIYVSDFNSRKQFLSTICDEKWDQQLPYLVKKPFIKLTYKDSYMKLLSTNQIENFPGLLGEGLEQIKEYLKECKTQNQTLHDLIIKCKEQFLHQTLQIHFKFHRFNLRICNFGVEKLNFIIILEKTITKTRFKHLPLVVRKDLQQQLHVSNLDFLRFFNWGLLSFVLLNNLTIRHICIGKTIEQLNKSFNKYIQPLQLISMNEGNFTLKTYINLFKIYMIQIYHIIIQLYNKEYTVKVQAKEFSDYIELQILLADPQMFLLLYKKNMFISTIERSILWNPVNRNLKIRFSKQLHYSNQ